MATLREKLRWWLRPRYEIEDIGEAFYYRYRVYIKPVVGPKYICCSKDTYTKALTAVATLVDNRRPRVSNPIYKFNRDGFLRKVK